MGGGTRSVWTGYGHSGRGYMHHLYGLGKVTVGGGTPSVRTEYGHSGRGYTICTDWVRSQWAGVHHLYGLGTVTVGGGTPSVRTGYGHSGRGTPSVRTGYGHSGRGYTICTKPHQLILPEAHTSKYINSFFYRSSLVWNTLPAAIQNITCNQTFKKKIEKNWSAHMHSTQFNPI